LLAHVIAHVASRDRTRQASAAELTRISTVAFPDPGGWTDYNQRQSPGMTIPLGFLQTWRERELDADRLAAGKMPAAGYDPEALARYIDREQAAQAGKARKVSSGMPSPAERLKAIHAVIGMLPAQSYPPHQGLDKAQEEVREEMRRLSVVVPPSGPEWQIPTLPGK
jgi:predicted Zn-dependent protease